MASQAAARRLPPLPTLRDILHMFKLKAMRKLSQNFLLDPRFTTKIVKTAGKIKGSHVVEVGPGPGCLTRPILELGATQVTVVEKDSRFLPSLELLAEASDDRLKIVIGDVFNETMEDYFPSELQKDWNAVVPNIHIIGNLPFNVSTPLIIRWLRMISLKTGPFTYGRVPMTLTFQKEVAERIVAPLMDAQRCRLSVMCQNYCHVKHKFNIPGGAFVPKPDVDVGVVKLIPREEPDIKLPFDLVEKVCNCLFNARQKDYKNTVRNLFPTTHEKELNKLLQLTEIDPETKVIQLSVEEIGRICEVYNHFCIEDPELYKYNFRLGRR
ncbi:dimethyladenosine transferase 1, mitochondrial-like [Ornithodoros turicata]|uniref:dimethyladenosine transferase 1, mitochondrial-like n=1 Tax=Ornithodoros turicata TaxID=34597 RepID=UPI003138FA02